MPIMMRYVPDGSYFVRVLHGVLKMRSNQLLTRIPTSCVYATLNNDLIVNGVRNVQHHGHRKVPHSSIGR